MVTVTLREYATVDGLSARYWSADPADPRASTAWLTANRWPEDGVRFLEATAAGAACAVRAQDDHTGFPRMNCTGIVAGTGRDVTQPEADLKEARAEGLRQLNVCALGYGQSVFPARIPEQQIPVNGADFDADALVTALEEHAGAQGRLLTFLHLDETNPVLPVLRERGWHVGVTDRYFLIEEIGADEADYLGRFPADRRRQLRRELASLDAAGAAAEIHRGDTVTDAIQQEVALLEACADEKHGIPGDPGRLLRVNERLRTAFGPRYAVALVRDRDGRAVASATLVLGTRDVLLRMVGLGPGSEDIGAYFHVAYHLPMRLARSTGASRVLLGTGNGTPKLRRGATAQPLLSAVPPAAAAHGALLRRTDAAFAARP
ncbi:MULTISPECIES: peptidogalycan biosysnthesis protein [unclassified Streptomyces]|uniref:peptidogalycan biosysnthesis protein n=1 Tax=unclassified Streptomyces TaxID=2593676 RepID=UPI001BE690E8|nr:MULTISPECIES: peptidogalycan biosysnthesis protein [unclassified Streptomyces]MBT2408659.1 N-acetyltransferase [Streptomyces sp. ISL-21]MBT2608657.1 N-acetyltransferase [Streptomyces sp. ISL-87]